MVKIQIFFAGPNKRRFVLIIITFLYEINVTLIHKVIFNLKLEHAHKLTNTVTSCISKNQ